VIETYSCIPPPIHGRGTKPAGGTFPVTCFRVKAVPANQRVRTEIGTYVIE